MAKIEVGIVVPRDWAMNYLLRGGNYGDLEKALLAQFPDFEFNPGLVGPEPNDKPDVLQITNQGEEPDRRLTASERDAVLEAVISFYKPELRPQADRA